MPQFKSLAEAAYSGTVHDMQEFLMANADIGEFSCTGWEKLNALQSAIRGKKPENLAYLLANCTASQLWSTCKDERNRCRDENAFVTARSNPDYYRFYHSLVLKACSFLDNDDVLAHNFHNLVVELATAANFKAFSEYEFKLLAEALKDKKTHLAAVFLAIVKTNQLMPIRVLLENGADVDSHYKDGESALQLLLSASQVDLQILDLFAEHKVNFEFSANGKLPIDYCKSPLFRSYFVEFSDPSTREAARTKRRQQEEAARVAREEQEREQEAIRLAHEAHLQYRREVDVWATAYCGLGVFFLAKPKPRPMQNQQDAENIVMAEIVTSEDHKQALDLG